MANIGSILKEEIRRLAKREARAMFKKLQSNHLKLKARVAELRQEVAVLERLTVPLKKAPLSLCEAELTPERVNKARISAKIVAVTRKRLRLSQADFAKLLGVTGNTVWQWENRKNGRLQIRDKAKAAFVSVRGIGVREAKRRLELMN